ncbi:MAG: VWA domain-containing protein [Ruminococcaceae bacterium]|nr:VWA domain-containing protein [Oscillospiraceae bacterium]
MSFLYPLGLLGLIGVPILIFIYIIKSKYTEQTVSSTYLWTLSEKFLKRKNPLSRLTGIISLILQILSVILISLAIAHPIIAIPNAANEYCFILDASGSMNMISDEKTRFENGKDEIKDIINGASEGSTFSLVYVGDDTGVVYERTDDKEQAIALLDELKVAYNTADLKEALGIAQGYFNENPSTLVYLVSDKAYGEHKNVNVIDLSRGEENYAVSDVVYTNKDGILEVSGSVVSYKSDASITVGLYIDGADDPAAIETISVNKGEKTPFTFTASSDRFSSFSVKVLQSDALALDNEYIVYDLESESSYDTLIVSERPYLIKAMLGQLLHAKIDVIKPSEYSSQSGYGLYIFDSVAPDLIKELPQDGTVWLMNLGGSVNGSGFSVQGEVTFDGSDVITLTDSSSSTAQALIKDLRGEGIHLTKYVKCGFYRNFTTVFSYKGNPIVFAGTTTNGSREVVFAFDIHDSNLPLLSDYGVLMRNIVNYSFPDMVEKTSYESSQEAQINVIANCESIRVESPLGNVTYLDTSSAIASLPLNEAGVYNITMTVAGSAREFSIYSSFAESERDPAQSEESIALQGEKSSDGFDGKYDPLTVIFIILAFIFLADWMVYCYDKYQLR